MIDLSVSLLSIIKIAYSFGGNLHVEFGPNGFAIVVAEKAHVVVNIGTPATKRVTVVEATTMCAPVPVVIPWPPHFESRCLTLPAITVEVPDFTRVQYTPFPAGVALSVSVNSSGGIGFALDSVPKRGANTDHYIHPGSIVDLSR